MRDYSEKNPKILDEVSRRDKAKKILRILQDVHAGDLKSFLCLDIGCSGGIIDAHLSRNLKRVVGIDVDRTAVASAHTRFYADTAFFLIGDGTALGFKDDVFDVVICNHIYEHVTSAQALFHEIYRVLRPGGICYLAAANKFSVVEGHHHLPFLSWIPRAWGDRYVKWSGKGDRYEERCLSVSALRNLVKQFRVFDYTVRTIRDPVHFEMTDVLPIRNRVLLFFLSLLALVGYYFLPTYLWILRKE